MTEIWVHFKLYFKRRMAVVYAPWILNVHYDWCAFNSGQLTLDLLAKMTIAVARSMIPSIFESCPYTGRHGLYNVNLAFLGESVIPQVLPDGNYKLGVRVYIKSTNVTYAEGFVSAEIRAAKILNQWDF